VSDATISKWISGRQDIPTRYLAQVAKLIGVSVETLLPGADAGKGADA
jgi:DNA-binding transcriptional regulator YdaS (Cro superfamily)